MGTKQQIAQSRLPDRPRGMDLLNHQLLNKSTAFTEDERSKFGLHGILPAHVESLEQQQDTAYSLRDSIPALLRNRPNPKVNVIVVTDGGRILGGIRPERVNDPEYLDWRHERTTGRAYFDFVDQFVQAVKQEFRGTCLQWEDFATPHARPILQRYRYELLTFNDEIQVTPAPAVGTVLATVKLTGTGLKDQQIVIFRAGSAGIGIANGLPAAMKGERLCEQEARSHFWVVDRGGVSHSGRTGLSPEQSVYAPPEERGSGWPQTSNGQIGLANVIGRIEATILIGLSAVGGAWRVTDGMMLEAARALAAEIAIAVRMQAQKDSVAPRLPEDELPRRVIPAQWTPAYPSFARTEM
jgi:malate dehydrogenase (oxaloacetate-decarboxylating)